MSRRGVPGGHRGRPLLRVALGVLVAAVVAGAAAAQSLPEAPRRQQPDERPLDPRRLERRPLEPRQLGPVDRFQLQFEQIDQLIRLGYYSRANTLLDDFVRVGAPEREVLRRRIVIARGIEDHAQAAELCRQALLGQPEDAWLWRELAAALLALDDRASAHDALSRFLALADEPRGGLTVAVDLLRTSGDCRRAVALVDSGRTVLGDPRFLSRVRALCLLQLDEARAAAREIQVDLQTSPFNLQLLRRELLATGALPLPPALTAELVALAAEPNAQPELTILTANIALAQGQAQAALGVIEPRLAQTHFASSVLQNASSLAGELPLLAPGAERAAASEYLLAVLPALAEHGSFAPSLRQRACDHLAEVCLFALENDLLDQNPAAAVGRFGGLLDVVQRGYPESAHLYSAQIQLARFTRDRLRDPQAAAARLERLLLDLDLPLPGVAVARLSLGESYLAARDTSRARRVLTALGRDPEVRESAGHAHFLLAKLDLAQGHFGTARDRFAAVALDQPAAPYANDALWLGLLIAEELQNPSGGLELLARYAPSVWWNLAAEPDSQRVALTRYVNLAARQVDQSAPQSLLEHARFELADLLRQAGRLDEALAQLDRVVLDLPHGRLAPRALVARAEILAAEFGDAAAAGREYERLLVQYPEYLFAAEVRQKLRSLP